MTPRPLPPGADPETADTTIVDVDAPITGWRLTVTRGPHGYCSGVVTDDRGRERCETRLRWTPEEVIEWCCRFVAQTAGLPHVATALRAAGLAELRQ